ncbi:MAG TPA: serine O-acetyltransferase EpsC [Candidatus Binataceae bacterium]|nr:serine O-acetyltransferase EpsC [Candidatus Binataceae bacterium]
MTVRNEHHLASERWELERIVAELRVSRGKRPRNGKDARVPFQMPSREALHKIIDGLFAALFPTHFGWADLSEEGVDYFVGHTLDATLHLLQEQVVREFRSAATQDSQDRTALEHRAFELTRSFAGQLPKIRALLETDIHAAYQGDPAAKSIEEVRFCYPGITGITYHRIAHELHQLGTPLLARIVAEIAHSATGIDIHPGAQIGGSFFIDHGTGVVIGETAIIGVRVRLYQAVTLGAKRFPVGENGVLVKGAPRHPIVEDDVVIYSGATILGRVTIGRGSTIGGNVWITRDVPPGSHVTQALARSEAYDDGGGI